MRRKRYKLTINIFLLIIIGLLGFKDTGIFVREYISIKDDGTKQVFIKEERVNVVGEKQEMLIVEKDSILTEVPKTTMIRTTRSTQKYKVITNTPILEKPSEKTLRILRKDEVLQIEKYVEDYGIFKTEDKISGYVKLSDLEAVVEDTLSQGISKVDKVIKRDNSYYVLSKGEIVVIKDFKDNKYIIVNEKGLEFEADESFIELKASKEMVSRSSISRKTNALSKVVESAYSTLGSRYIYGDIGNRGYDCSGLTYSIYLNNLGIKLQRSSYGQATDGIKVDKSELIAGDLLFFNTSGKKISHVGIYVGDGNMIHASSGKRKVMVVDINGAYYKKRYVTARRIIR